MSLIECPECGRQISTAAIACPGCGYPAAQTYAPSCSRRHTFAAAAALALAIAGGAMWLGVSPFSHLRHLFHGHGHHHEHVEVVRVVAPPMVLPPPEIVVSPPVVRTLELSDVDVAPELMNSAEVARMMQRAYPPLMRDAGVEGQATVRFRVLPDGRVDAGSLSIEQATHDAFGLAAMRVASRMRFRPGRLDGEPVSTWMTMPLSFLPTGEATVEIF